MNIGFTGHRDSITDESELDAIATEYPGAVWVHGGAAGFDTQVARYAQAHGIEQVVKRPEYSKYVPKSAPIMRNYEIVDMCELVIACHDGRQTGGTARTIAYARNKDKPIRYVACGHQRMIDSTTMVTVMPATVSPDTKWSFDLTHVEDEEVSDGNL